MPAVITKGNNCREGDPCGTTCISRSYECAVGGLNPAVRAEVDKIRDSLLGAVPGYKEVKAISTVTQGNQISGGNAAVTALRAGMLLTGLSAIAYTKFRDRYRSGLDASADFAKTTGDGTKVPNIGGKKQITFTVDGLNTNRSQRRRGENLANEIAKVPGFEDHHIVPMRGAYNLGDTGTATGSQKVALQGMEQFKRVLDAAVVRNQNPLAVDMAAQAYAYNKQYPDRDINFVGEGTGGMVAREASEIYARIRERYPETRMQVSGGTPAPTRAYQESDEQFKMRYARWQQSQPRVSSTRVLTINSPDFGLMEGKGTRNATLTSRGSLFERLPATGKQVIDAPQGEFGKGVLQSRQGQAYMRGFFGNATPAPKATAPSTEVTAKPAAPQKTTPTTSTFTASTTPAPAAAPSTQPDAPKASQRDEKRIARFMGDMVGNKDLKTASIETLRKYYPEGTDEERSRAQAIASAPGSIREMFKADKIGSGLAAQVGLLTQSPSSRGDFLNILDDLEQKGRDPESESTLQSAIAQFKKLYRTDSALERWMARRGLCLGEFMPHA